MMQPKTLLSASLKEPLLMWLLCLEENVAHSYLVLPYYYSQLSICWKSYIVWYLGCWTSTKYTWTLSVFIFSLQIKNNIKWHFIMFDRYLKLVIVGIQWTIKYKCNRMAMLPLWEMKLEVLKSASYNMCSFSINASFLTLCQVHYLLCA